jgi:hypothetical protein
MENKDQPAFPVNEEATDRIDEGIKIYTGITKREYFSGLAMQGLLSTMSPGLYDSNTIATYAYEAVKAADYLLEELSNPQP